MKTFIIMLSLLPFFIGNAYAENIYSSAAEETGISAMEAELTDDELKISGRLVTDGSYNYDSAIQRLERYVLETVDNELSTQIGFAVKLIAVALMLNLGECLCSESKTKHFVSVVACAAAAKILVGDVESVVASTAEALNKLSDYSSAALPALFTAAAACGHVGSSAAKFAAVTLAIDVLISTAQRVIIPLIYAFLALSISNSLFPHAVLRHGSKLCKWLSTTLMTALTITFCTYIGLTGAVSGSVDAIALRTTKTVISTVLPVIGGIVSDASATVLSAAELIKNTAGVFGLIAVLIICAGPFCVLLVRYMLLKLAAAAADMFPNGSYAGLLSDVAAASGMLLGLLGCCGIMLFVSVMSAIKVMAV